MKALSKRSSRGRLIPSALHPRYSVNEIEEAFETAFNRPLAFHKGLVNFLITRE